MYDVTMQLETPRLVLRQPRLSDLDRWAEFMADPETANPIGGVEPRPMAWRGLATMAGAWMIGGFGMFSVLEKSSGDWAFAELGWTEVIHMIAPDNLNSQAVARRPGSAKLRSALLLVPCEGFTVEVWGQTRAQWCSQRARLPLREAS